MENDVFSAIQEIQKKYSEIEIEIVKKALTFEIGTNTQMVEALTDMNWRYLNEVGLYDPNEGDFNPCLIECFENAERDGINVIRCAKSYLDISNILNTDYFVNKDGDFCDEYGNRMSEDGEYRVFETIKGTGDKTSEHSASLNVVKGNTEP